MSKPVRVRKHKRSVTRNVSEKDLSAMWALSKPSSSSRWKFQFNKREIARGQRLKDEATARFARARELRKPLAFTVRGDVTEVKQIYKPFGAYDEFEVIHGDIKKRRRNP